MDKRMRVNNEGAMRHLRTFVSEARLVYSDDNLPDLFV